MYLLTCVFDARQSTAVIPYEVACKNGVKIPYADAKVHDDECHNASCNNHSNKTVS